MDLGIYLVVIGISIFLLGKYSENYSIREGTKQNKNDIGKILSYFDNTIEFKSHNEKFGIIFIILGAMYIIFDNIILLVVTILTPIFIFLYILNYYRIYKRNT